MHILPGTQSLFRKMSVLVLKAQKRDTIHKVHGVEGMLEAGKAEDILQNGPLSRAGDTCPAEQTHSNLLNVF